MSDYGGKIFGLLLALSISVWAMPAYAGGYSQGFQGTTAAGLSGAMTARPDVPEAGYFNPAGFALQNDWGFAGGLSGLFPMVSHEDPETRNRTRARADGAFPPHLHGYGRWRQFAVGMSLGVPYGGGLRWPDDWAGRFEVTSTSLQAFEAAPSFAWRPLDWLAIGGGPRFVWANVGFERQIDTARPGEEASVALEAGAPGVGGQVGIWVRPLDFLSLGMSWRSAITLDFEGVARFQDIPPEMSHVAHDTIGRTTMILPHRMALGVAYELADQGIISLDFEFNRWSVYDTFEVNFDSEDVPDTVEDRNWSDTVTMRFGAEYRSPIDNLSIRSGFAIDPSPAPRDTISPAQPDMDRYIVSLGAGFEAVEGLLVDVAYNYVILSRTTAAGDGFPGVYDGQVHVFSLGFRYP